MIIDLSNEILDSKYYLDLAWFEAHALGLIDIDKIDISEC